MPDILLTRRKLIGGIGLALAAPFIVKAASLMPVRARVINIVYGRSPVEDALGWAVSGQRMTATEIIFRQAALSAEYDAILQRMWSEPIERLAIMFEAASSDALGDVAKIQRAQHA